MMVLGISIGTRTSGIAIIDNNVLIYWNTLSFRDKWSEQKGAHIISRYERYLKKHEVTAVVLKIPRITHHTEAILGLLDKVQSVINKHGCMLVHKTQADIKLAVPDISNNRQLIIHAAKLYPVLLPEQDRELASRNRYHDKMFEAVIVAHLYKKETELSSKNQ